MRQFRLGLPFYYIDTIKVAFWCLLSHIIRVSTMKRRFIIVLCAVVATGGVRAQGELTLAGFERKMIEV